MKPSLRIAKAPQPLERPAIERIGRTLLTGKPYIPAADHVTSEPFLERQRARMKEAKWIK